jgi:hypothetical protein
MKIGFRGSLVMLPFDSKRGFVYCAPHPALSLKGRGGLEEDGLSISPLPWRERVRVRRN